MENSVREPLRHTGNNETNRNAVNGKQPVKRTAGAVDPTETSTDLPSENITEISANNRLEHNCDDGIPKKKAKVRFINQFPSRLKFHQQSQTFIRVPSNPKLFSNNSYQSSEKFDGVSSCARTIEISNIVPKCHNKNVLRGIVMLDTSISRLDVDIKPFVKDEKQFKEEIVNSPISKGKKLNDNSIEKFKLLMHVMNLTIEDNYELIALLKVLDSSTVVNEIYCLKKQTDCRELYSFVEAKYIRENRTINYKQLMGPEFDLRRYFKIFMQLKETYKITGDMKIYCNRDLNRGSLQKNDVSIISPDGKLCQLQIHQNHDIRRSLLDCCVLPNLAKKILECICGNNKPITKKYKLLKKYHAALVREKVFEIIIEEQDRRSFRKARFHKKFVNEEENLSEPGKELRQHLINNLPNGLNQITRDMSCEVYDGFGKDDGNSVLNLPYENYSELFETFFKGLYFEMCNDDDVDITMKNKFGEDFTKIKDELPLKVMQDEVFLHIEERRSNDLFQSIKNIISQFTIKKGLLKISEPKINVEFEQEVFGKFEQFFCENDSQSVILYRSDYIHLSTLKIKQLINKITNNACESLFINSKTLLERPDDVVSVLSSKLIDILVIQLDEHSNENEMGTVLTKLERCITADKYVMVVLNTNSSKKLNYSFKQIFDENHLFNLTSESQNKVLNCENVYLHGRSLCIRDIAEGKVATELIKDSKILEDILFAKLIIGNDLVEPNGFTEKLFTMQLTQDVIINEAIFNKDCNDIFGISNINYEDFRKYVPCEKEYKICHYHEIKPYAKFILLPGENDLKSKLQEISEKRMEQNVHLLKFESGKFVWETSIGRKDSLIEYKIANNESVSVREIANVCDDERIFDVLNNDSKMNIISGRSGIGKSVFLYELAKNLLTSKDPYWIIQLSLSEVLLEQYSNNEILDYEMFLINATGFNEACRKIFAMAMDGKLELKLVLFIDDYDVMRKYTSISFIENILKQLQISHVYKIYVAGIPKTTERLEKALGIFSYSLEFSRGEKELFLEKYQSNNSLEIPAHLTDTPLHLKMLADLCRQGVNDLKCFKDFYGLYREYVKLKLKNCDFEMACEIAINNLLENREFDIPNLHLPKIDMKFKFPEEIQQGTFTEYFAARWLSRKFREYSEERSKFVDFVMRLKECTSPVFVDTYYSSLSALDSLVDDLFQAVEIGNINEIERLLKNDCLVNARDKSRKSLLHRVNDDKTMEFLIGRYGFDVDATDSEGKTALHLVVEKDLLNCTIMLLKVGASYNIKDQQGKRPYNRQKVENKSAKMLRMIEKLFKDLKSDDPKIFVSKNPDVLGNYFSEAKRIYDITPKIIVNAKDKRKKTLVDYAKKINYLSIAKILMKYCEMDSMRNEYEKRKMNKVGSTTEDKPKDESVVEPQHLLLKNVPQTKVAELSEIIVESSKISDPNTMRDSVIKYYDEREFSLKVVEANVLPSNSWLNDESIDAFMRILRKTHPDIMTQSTLYQQESKDIAIKPVTVQQEPSIQIIGGTCINHWRCLYFDGKTIRIYDSKYSKAAELSAIEQRYVKVRYPSVASCDIKFVRLLTEQPDSHSCGVYAVAFAETLSSDGDPASVKYSLDVDKMRRHFAECIKTGRTSPFPRDRNKK